MEENGMKDEKIEGAKIKLGALAWLDNFWYHYKWHTLIGAFVLLVVIVCSVQMCSKTAYDVYFMYAGGYEISHKSEGGDVSEYVTFGTSLKYGAKDYDGDGEINVSFMDLFMLTSEELRELELDPDESINYNLLHDNQERLYDSMLYSSYYLCFLSPAVYDEYKVISDVEIFSDLGKYENGKLEFYDDGAIYLRSTAFAELPGICDLPEDTVISLRALSAVASHLNKEENREAFERSIECLEKILNYGN